MLASPGIPRSLKEFCSKTKKENNSNRKESRVISDNLKEFLRISEAGSFLESQTALKNPIQS